MNKSMEIAAPTRPMPLLLDELKAGLWSTATKIRFGQCDPAGIVYTPNFFDIFNVVVEEWYLQALGIDYYDLIGRRRTGLGYVNAHADFFLPCAMGTTLDVALEVEHVGTSSFRILLHAFSGPREALRGRFTVVTTCLESHRPTAIPEDLRAALLLYAKS